MESWRENSGDEDRSIVADHVSSETSIPLDRHETGRYDNARSISAIVLGP
jgi:hypothetical protein